MIALIDRLNILTGKLHSGQTNLISGSMDIFQNLKGRLVGKKRKIKKIPNFLHWL